MHFCIKNVVVPTNPYVQYFIIFFNFVFPLVLFSWYMFATESVDAEEVWKICKGKIGFGTCGVFYSQCIRIKGFKIQYRQLLDPTAASLAEVL